MTIFWPCHEEFHLHKSEKVSGFMRSSFDSQKQTLGSRVDNLSMINPNTSVSRAESGSGRSLETPSLSNPLPSASPSKIMNWEGSNRRTKRAASLSRFEALSLKLAQSNASPGEYWLICKDGEEPWPGIICDEPMVQEFMKREMPTNAQRSDGSWDPHVLPHGKLAGQKNFPMLRLGALTL